MTEAIKTWQERLDANYPHPDRSAEIVQHYMQAEIEELRSALKEQSQQIGELIVDRDDWKEATEMANENARREEGKRRDMQEQRDTLAALKAQPVNYPFFHGGVKVARKDHASGLLDHLARWMRREQHGDFQTLELVSAYVRRLEASAAPVQEPLTTGCACRWDKDDVRVATCARHQGWLDVVQEWSQRAKDAEAAPQPVQPAPLTDEQIENGYVEAPMQPKVLTSYEIWVTAVRWAEATLRTGVTG